MLFDNYDDMRRHGDDAHNPEWRRVFATLIQLRARHLTTPVSKFLALRMRPVKSFLAQSSTRHEGCRQSKG
jgi:hypothetical protein